MAGKFKAQAIEILDTGYLKEIFDVLIETDGLLEDFYIVPTNFAWTIAYCDDGENAVLYRV